MDNARTVEVITSVTVIAMELAKMNREVAHRLKSYMDTDDKSLTAALDVARPVLRAAEVTAPVLSSLGMMLKAEIGDMKQGKM